MYLPVFSMVIKETTVSDRAIIRRLVFSGIRSPLQDGLISVLNFKAQFRTLKIKPLSNSKIHSLFE